MEGIFWKNYSDFEQTYINKYFSSSWLTFSHHRLIVANNNVGNFITNTVKVFYLGTANEYDNESFGIHILKKKKNFIILIMVGNILFLFVLSIFVKLSTWDIILPQLGVWILLSTGYLCFMIISCLVPTILEEVIGKTPYQVWIHISFSIFFSRLLIIINRITQYNLFIEEHKCYTEYLLTQITVDTVQTIIFLLMPLQFPWSIGLCFVEMTSQLLRFKSCSSSLLANSKLEWLKTAIYSGIFLTYFIILLSSLIYEKTAVKSFKNKNLFKKKSRINIELLKSLCNDLKSVLQHLVKSISHIDHYFKNNNNINSNDIIVYTNIKKSLSRNVQFLDELSNEITELSSLLIDEVHFEFQFIKVVDIRSFVKFSVSTWIKKLHKKNNFQINIDDKCLISDDLVLKTVLRSFQSLLRFFVFLSTKLNSNEIILLISINGKHLSIVIEENNDKNKNGIKTTSIFYENGIERGVEDVHIYNAINTKKNENFFNANDRALLDDSIYTDAVLNMCAQLATCFGESLVIEKASNNKSAQSAGGSNLETKLFKRISCKLHCDFAPMQYNQQQSNVNSNNFRTSDFSNSISNSSTKNSNDFKKFTKSLDNFNFERFHTESLKRNSSNANNVESDSTSLGNEAKICEFVCCIFVDDFFLEPLVTDVVKRASNTVSVFSLYFQSVQRDGFDLKNFLVDNNQDDMNALWFQQFDIIFVTSISLCKKLRFLKFEGQIVLFLSEFQASLIVDSNAYDFSLPLPCLDADFKKFVLWLETQVTLTKPTNKSSDRNTSNGSEAHLNHKQSIAYNDYMVKNFSNRNVFFRSFDKTVLETYCLWRVLNPTNSFFHHTNLTPCSIIAIAIFNMLNHYYSIEQSSIHLLIKLTVISFLLASAFFRSWVYKYFIHFFGFKLNLLWQLFSLIYVLSFLFQTLSSFILISKNSKYWISVYENEPNHDLTLVEFSEKTFFDKTNGKLLIIDLLKVHNLISGFLIYLSWPFINLQTICSYLRFSYITMTLMRLLLDSEVVKLLMITLGWLFLVVLFAQFQLEKIYRDDFYELRKILLKKEFFENCFTLCQYDAIYPLKQISNLKKKIIRIIYSIVMKQELILNKQFLNGLDALHMGSLLTEKIVYEIEFNKRKDDEENFIEGNNLSDVACLSMEVFKILSLFSMSITNCEVKVFFDVDCDLGLIRFDLSMFKTLLSNSCKIAVSNFEKAMQEKLGRKNLINQIVVLISPFKVAATEKFTDTRLMMVTVLDSSQQYMNFDQKSALNSDYSNSFNDIHYHKERSSTLLHTFGQAVCRKIVLKSSSFSCFESGLIKHIHYGYFQRFTVPYKLTVDSSKGKMDVQRDKTILQLIEKNESLLNDYYRIFFQSSNNNTNKQSIRSSGLFKSKHQQTIAYMCNSNYRFAAENARIVSFFHENGFDCNIVYSSKAPLLMQVDCIVIDSNIINYDPTLAHQHSSASTIRSNIIRLRLSGFLKVIAILNNESNSENEITIIDNNNNDMFEGDFEIKKPLTNSMLTQLGQFCDKKVLDLILNNN